MNMPSLDVDFLAGRPIKTILRLEEARRTAERNRAVFTSTVYLHERLFFDLEALDIEPRFDFIGNGSIDLVFAGDGNLLGQVWGLLRRAGYNTTSRPAKGDTTFYAFWDNPPSARIWVQFSSSVCQRVQVGTEMKEVPVYEVRCGETLQIEGLA